MSRIMNGVNTMTHSIWKMLIYLMYVALFIIWIIPVDNDSIIVNMDTSGSVIFGKAILFVLGTLAVLYIVGAPLNAIFINNKLEKIGLVNRAGQPPYLLTRHNNGISEVWEFYTSGVSLKEWDAAASKVEAVLNMIYVKCEYGKDREHILVHLVSPSDNIPTIARWETDYVDDNENIINVGVGLLGLVKLNLELTPHILIGGATNCGKTRLVIAILLQGLIHGDYILIADRKGGIDYEKFKLYCPIITTIEALLKVLDGMLAEMEHRQILLRQSGCPNVTEYNETHEHHLSRIVLAVDEVSEWLDKTGLSKEEKQTIDAIIGKLSTLARLGRATNISLIMSQQRPDATVLPGQIKAQLGYRIAGRCDDVLSQIILDNTNAAEKIPFDARGLFLNNDDVLFRGFYITDDQIKRY